MKATDIQAGHEVTGPGKYVTSYRTWLFSGGWPRFDGWPAKNVHTDLEFARACGLPVRGASAATAIAYLSEMMVDLFGEEWLHMRCPGGASGHETDKVSASSPANARPLAKGLNPDDGGAEIVCFDTPSGGHVFSVGSISWPASLPVDEQVSRITRNVLQRFLA